MISFVQTENENTKIGNFFKLKIEKNRKFLKMLLNFKMTLYFFFFRQVLNFNASKFRK